MSYLNGLSNFKLIMLPPKGSDMNPVENLWGVISKRMKVNPKWNIDEYRMNVLLAWEYYVTKDGYLEVLSKSMTERFMSVIGMDGRWTKY